MKSLIYQPNSPFTYTPSCGPKRTEVSITLEQDGRLYTMVVRDKIIVEDPYLLMVKATAFAIKEGEPYNAQRTPRDIRDFLIKNDTVV